MDFKRADRVGDLIRAEIMDILLRKTKDPRVGFATVTAVKVSDDLKHARVLVSVMGGEDDKRRTMKGLKSAVSFIRGELGRRLKLRYTPELTFALDESIERGDKTLDLLKKLKAEGEDNGPDE